MFTELFEIVPNRKPEYPSGEAWINQFYFIYRWNIIQLQKHVQQLGQILETIETEKKEIIKDNTYLY